MFGKDKKSPTVNSAPTYIGRGMRIEGKIYGMRPIWIDGEVQKINPKDKSLKIPHMGWNTLNIESEHPVLKNIHNGDHVYFVHSFHMMIKNQEQRLAYTDYGADITAVVGKENMVGLQFHPEKSGQIGLKMIENFLSWRP